MIFCGCSYCAERRTSSFARKTLKRWRHRRNRDNPYSQEDRDKVIAECRDTELSYRAIALKTGISRETVSRWCRKAGYPRQRGRKNVPQNKRRKILELFKNTELNFSQIARHPDVELPRTTVRDIIKFQDVTKNPVHESRLTGLLTMAIWPTDDVNEANNAKGLALNMLNKAIADDINELKLIFRKVIGQAGSHLGSNEKLEAIWEEATNQNPELTISYRELLGEREKKPAKKKAKKKKPTKKKTYRTRRTRRSGVCILCGEDSRGKPYCRRHYYEFIGREYYETCQVPGCDNPSFGQPKCREHYYGGRRRTRRRRPRRRPSRLRRRNPEKMLERWNPQKYSNQQKAEVLRLCEETDLTYAEIARQTGVSYQTVRKRCLAAGSRYATYYTDEQKAEVLRLCKETNLTYAEIARQTGVIYQTARDWCLAAGSRYVTYYTDEQKAEVLRLCEETDLIYKEIARQTRVDYQTIRNWCLAAGSRYVTYYTDEQKAQVLRLCEETDLSYVEIARQTGVDRQAIRNWCLKEGIRRNPKYRRNSDESIRRRQREAASGDSKEAYYRQLMRAGQPIPSLVKAHKKLMRAIRNFPMARTHQLSQEYGVNRPLRTSMTKQPFLQRPEEAIEYILPADGGDREIIDASVYGQTPIAILLDSLEAVIARAYILLEPDRPAGGGEVVAGLQSVYYGNYTHVAEAARGLAKAAAEIRFMFIDGEKDAIWGMATALLQEVIALSTYAIGFGSAPRRVVKSLEGRIKEFGKRIISKSRISHITGEISELAGLMQQRGDTGIGFHSAPDAAIRLRVINRRWIYLIAHLLMIAKRFK